VGELVKSLFLIISFVVVFWCGYFSGTNICNKYQKKFPFEILEEKPPKCFHSRQEKERRGNVKNRFVSGSFIEIVDCQEWNGPSGD
jgi:hypothetical protein